MGYQESYVYTNSKNVEANNKDIESILTVFKKYGVRCHGDFIAACVCKVKLNKDIEEFKSGMEMLVISGDRSAQRNNEYLFDIFTEGEFDPDEIKEIEYTEDELALIERVKLMYIEEAPSILAGEESGDITVEPLCLVSDDTYFCGASISFPYFLGNGEKKENHHFLIETTKERHEKFLEIDKVPGNYWNDENIEDLCEDITKLASLIVLSDNGYWTKMIDAIIHSPYISAYEKHLELLTNAWHIAQEGNIEGNEELITDALEIVVDVLHSAGGYRITFEKERWNGDISDEEILKDYAAFEEDEDADYLLIGKGTVTAPDGVEVNFVEDADLDDQLPSLVTVTDEGFVVDFEACGGDLNGYLYSLFFTDARVDEETGIGVLDIALPKELVVGEVYKFTCMNGDLEGNQGRYFVLKETEVNAEDLPGDEDMLYGYNVLRLGNGENARTIKKSDEAEIEALSLKVGNVKEELDIDLQEVINTYGLK